MSLLSLSLSLSLHFWLTLFIYLCLTFSAFLFTTQTVTLPLNLFLPVSVTRWIFQDLAIYEHENLPYSIIICSKFSQKLNHPYFFGQRLILFCQSGKISPNLVTLLSACVGSFTFEVSRCFLCRYVLACLSLFLLLLSTFWTELLLMWTLCHFRYNDLHLSFISISAFNISQPFCFYYLAHSYIFLLLTFYYPFIAIPWSSLEDGDEGLYLPNCQTNLVIILCTLSLSLHLP